VLLLLAAISLKGLIARGTEKDIIPFSCISSSTVLFLLALKTTGKEADVVRNYKTGIG
jgi:hypothetical protein